MDEDGREQFPTEGKSDFWKNPRPTNENPNFIRDYFASSRLHFIGSFRARYESMMVAVGKKLGVKPGDLLHLSADKALVASKRKSSERVIVHVDMDCFFASVAIKKDPSLAGKCIAVCHGGGEISSCSYEARKFGVRAGMFFRSAIKLCPELLSVPYEFPMYEEVSIQIYALFCSHQAVCVEAVSVDEAYLDLTLAVGDDTEDSQSGAESLVRDLRSRIFAETGCTASAGIGPSKLIARLATKGAKPNGQLRIRQENVIKYLDTLNVKDLPGVGWRTKKRLMDLGVKTCPQLRALSLSKLQSEFGERQGQVFYDLARALDARQVEPLKPRKSIGAEASWGVRFEKEEGEKARKFVMDMADEVGARVIAAGAYGTKVTFKVYKKKPNSSMVGSKHLGHGPCTVLTRSAKISPQNVSTPLNVSLREICLRLHDELGVQNEELRGVGLQMTELSFSDLNFDYSSVPTIGATRRIDSFFEMVPSASKLDVLSLKSGQSPLLKTTELKTKSAGNESVEEEKRVSEENAKDFKSTITTDADVEVGEASDEDRIEVGRAEPLMYLRCNASTKTKDIPSGWDKAVFHALPEGIREELLADTGTSKFIIPLPSAEENEKHVPKGEEPPRKRKRVTFQAFVENYGGDKHVEQVTMTQFADISKLKEKGHDVLNAEEFREQPLRECVELLEDLQVKRLKALNSLQEAKEGQDEDANLDEEHMKKSSRPKRSRESKGRNIPSPPALSSDSESNQSINIDSETEEQFRDDDQLYEDESITDYAVLLKTWMLSTAGDLRSAHVELLRGRILEFVRRNMLERTRTEMSVIKNFAEDDRMGDWGKRYNGLVGDVQNEALRLYGFTLVLPKIEK